MYLILVSNHEWERERENRIEEHYYYLRIYEREYERILKTDRLIEVELEPDLHSTTSVPPTMTLERRGTYR